MASNTSEPLSHPYFPHDVKIIGYTPNEQDSSALISVFTAGCAVIFSTTYLLLKKAKRPLPPSEFWTIIWFVMCGFIHIVMEGYYAFNFRTMGSKQDLLGQMWKVYSLSDSRYQSQNAFLTCMETITAVCWGPLSFLVAVMITTRHPLRYPLQLMISLGQLYGDVLYFSMNVFDEHMYGLSYSRPEPEVFWGLYVFLNSIWIVIPPIMIYSSVKATSRAFIALDKSERTILTSSGVCDVVKGPKRGHKGIVI